MSDNFEADDQDEEMKKQARMAAWNKLAGNQQMGPNQGSAIKADVIPEQPGMVEGLGNIGRAIQLKGLRDDQAAHDSARQTSGDLPSGYQSPSQLAQKSDVQDMAMGSIGSGNGGKAFRAAREEGVAALPKVKQWTTEGLQALKDQAMKIQESSTIPQADKSLVFQKLRRALDTARVRGVKLPEGE